MIFDVIGLSPWWVRPNDIFHMVVDLCQVFVSCSAIGDEKMRLLDWLTMRSIGGQAIVEILELALENIIPWEVVQILATK